jgi:hypothetical protein
MQEVLRRPSSRRPAAVSIIALLASIAVTNTPVNAHSRQTKEAEDLDARVTKITAVTRQQQGLRNWERKAAVLAWGNY